MDSRLGCERKYNTYRREGDNLGTLMSFFKNDKSALKEFVKNKDLKKDRKFRVGETITLKEDNVLSQSLRYAQGDEDFEESGNYDCQGFVATTILKKEAKLDKLAFPNSNSPEERQEYGKLMHETQEILDTEQIPGKTFSFWNMNGIFPVKHAAIHFGYDKKGNEYFVTKNGTVDRPTVQTQKQMPYLFMWLRTNYKP